MKLLLVEDHEINLKLLRATLQAEGVETLEAADGLEAMALLGAHSVDAIISDILMPNMDGYRLCYEVRHNALWRNLPFIFYTSTYDSGEDETVALDMGADLFLRKPQPVRVILRAISDLIARGPRPELPDEPKRDAELMKQYSERLVFKLEEQITELRRRSNELAKEVAERKRAERRAEESLALAQRSGQALLHRIEEQESAELALRESEQRLRLALDAAKMGTFDWDVATNHLTWSHWHEEMWGFNPGEFKGRFEDFSERVHPDDRDLVRTRIRECMEARDLFSFEFRLVWPDGSLHWIQSWGEFTYGAEGQPLRMRGVVLETTARKLSEDALRASEERHRLLAHNATDVIWMMNLEGRLTYISPSVERFRGFTPSEALGQTWEEALTPESAELAAIQFADARAELRAGRPFPSSRHEVQYRRKDGSTVWAEVKTSGMLDEDGRLIGILGVSRDVTERRHLMAQLEAERARLLEAQAVARVGSWQTELPGLALTWSEQTHRIFETNPEAPAVLTHDDFLGLVHPEDRDMVESAFLQALGSDSPHTVEHRILMPDGRVKYVEERWHTFADPGGRPVRAVGTCRDITEQKLADAALREAYERLRVVVESSPLAILGVDASGRIASWNAGAERMFGWSRAEAIGQVCPTVPPDGLADYHAMVARLTRGETIEALARYRQRKDGTGINASLNAAPLRNASGKIVGGLIILENVTERMRAQEQMAAQLDELLRWQATVLGREERHQELKREVNALSVRLGEPIPYPSQETQTSRNKTPPDL